MGSEEEPSSSPKLQLFSILKAPTMKSPERSGMLTPPLHASASVPFRWEDEPGKPKPCTALVALTDYNNDLAPKCLELPPRLLLDANFSKLPSPTTVLEGPYMGKSSRFPSSFRMVGGECYGSFRAYSPPPPPPPERGQLGAMVLSKKGHKLKEKGFLGSWKRRALKGKREVGGGSYVFPSSVDRESDGSREVDESSETDNQANVKNTRIKRTGSFSGLSDVKSHFWGNIYDGLKQVIVPWRGRKQKKDGFIN